MRGARTYRCRDRGALRGAIPFSCHVQPMMRLLHSYLAPRYRRLPSHGLEEPLLSPSPSAISRCTCASIRLFLAPSPSIAFSFLPLLRRHNNKGTRRNPRMDKNVFLLLLLLFFSSLRLEFRIWRRSCLASCLICPIVFLRNAWMERTRRMYSRVRIW